MTFASPENNPFLPAHGAQTVNGREELIYRPVRIWRILTGLFGVALLLLAALCVGIPTGRLGLGPEAGIVGFFGLIALSTYALLSALRMRVVVTADGLEYRTAISSRYLARADIKGYRVLHRGVMTAWGQPAPDLLSDARLAIVPVDGAGRWVRVARVFAWDEPFKAWIATLTNLDAAERRQSETDILQNPGFGPTEGDRARALARARWTGYALSGIAIPLVACGYVVPYPPGIVILLLLVMPWVALAADAMGQGLFSVIPVRNDAHPSLFIALLLPGLVLTMRALSDDPMLGWELPIGAGLVGGGVFALVLALADRGVVDSPRKFLLVMPFALAYGFGAVAETNARLDGAPAEVKEVAVIGKHRTYGRRSSFYLQTEPWGLRATAQDVSVSFSLYNAVRPGGTVCVRLHPGALGMAWFTVARCQ